MFIFSVASALEQDAVPTEPLRIQDRRLEDVLEVISKTYGVDVELRNADWRDAVVSVRVIRGDVRSAIREMLRAYSYVLLPGNDNSWILTIYGLSQPGGGQLESRTEVDRQRVQPTSGQSLESEPRWIELEDGDGLRESIRVLSIDTLSDEHAVQSAESEEFQKTWIELERSDGTLEYIKRATQSEPP